MVNSKIVVGLTCVLVFAFGCGGMDETKAIPAVSIQNPIYSFQTFINPDKSFGYDIFRDSVKIIHQPHIPAIPGNMGFKTEIQAKKVAEHVIQKLENGTMPPTIDSAEIITIIK